MMKCDVSEEYSEKLYDRVGFQLLSVSGVKKRIDSSISYISLPPMILLDNVSQSSRHRSDDSRSHPTIFGSIRRI